MESFIIVYENTEYSASYRVTVIDGRIKYELLPGTLLYKTLTLSGDSKPEIL